LNGLTDLSTGEALTHDSCKDLETPIMWHSRESRLRTVKWVLDWHYWNVFSTSLSEN